MTDQDIEYLKAMQKEMEPMAKYTGGERYSRWLALARAIEELDQEPGHWVKGEKDKSGYYHFFCSECGEEIQSKNKEWGEPYCCNCGKKMEG